MPKPYPLRRDGFSPKDLQRRLSKKDRSRCRIGIYRGEDTLVTDCRELAERFDRWKSEPDFLEILRCGDPLDRALSKPD